MVRAVLHRPEMNGSGRGSREPVVRDAARTPLPRALRGAIYSIGERLAHRQMIEGRHRAVESKREGRKRRAFKELLSTQRLCR